MGLTWAAETTHKPDEQDFVGSIQKLKEAGCDIVATALGVRQTIVAFGTAKKLGWTDVSFIGSSAGFNTAVAKVPEGVTEGYYAAAGWSDYENRLDNPAVKEWADKFQAFAGQPADTAAQLGYSAADALVKAIEAAGPELTADSFRTAMEGLQYDDVVNDVPVNFGTDHQGGDLIVISKVDGGKWVEVGRVDPTKSN
jgi:branched-chain amino acid transport system substrate-binding protein